MKEFTNHPVHVFNENGDLSPSAFIPMCSLFKKSLSFLENETNINVGFPVCNSFKPVIHFDQVCYEVNLNDKFKKNEEFLKKLRVGILLILDYNEDRQIDLNEETKDQKATLYFNTISTNLKVSKGQSLTKCF